MTTTGRLNSISPVDAADVVFMNADKDEDPWLLLRYCVDRGAQLAVCTRGAAPVALSSKHLHPVLAGTTSERAPALA